MPLHFSTPEAFTKWVKQCKQKPEDETPQTYSIDEIINEPKVEPPPVPKQPKIVPEQPKPIEQKKPKKEKYHSTFLLRFLFVTPTILFLTYFAGDNLLQHQYNSCFYTLLTIAGTIALFKNNYGFESISQLILDFLAGILYTSVSFFILMTAYAMLINNNLFISGVIGVIGITTFFCYYLPPERFLSTLNAVNATIIGLGILQRKL